MRSYEEIIHELILSTLRPDQVLFDLSSFVYQSLNIHPMIYSFIIPADKLIAGESGYLNVVYYKNTRAMRVMVFKKAFSSLEIACQAGKNLLLNAPRYIFDDRFLFRR